MCVKAVLHPHCWEHKDTFQFETLLHTYIWGFTSSKSVLPRKLQELQTGTRKHFEKPEQKNLLQTVLFEIDERTSLHMLSSEVYVCVKAVLHLACWEHKFSFKLQTAIHTYIRGDTRSNTVLQ